MKSSKTGRFLLCLLLVSLAAVLMLTGCDGSGIKEVPTDDTYSFENPTLEKAQPDAGIVIDGVLDEAVYQENKWLYLNNVNGGNDVNIAMTSYFGENGMYFVYDVTESVPIYVNPDRSPVLNSCIEMYLAPSYLTKVTQNSIFEIDMQADGKLVFKKTDGKYGYANVVATNDIMAQLGATTKGGELNTPECNGYCLELFIPWDYMERMRIDVDSMKNGFVYVNPAHITSYNYQGTNVEIDRLWYFFAQQNGAAFGEVSQYFRFNEDGLIGGKPVKADGAENCTISYNNNVLPGLNTRITIIPDEGHTLTSVVVNGEEMIKRISYNEDGSATVTVRGTTNGVTVSAKAEKATDGNKTLTGKILVNDNLGGSLKDVVASYTCSTGEKELVFDSKGNFELKDMAQGYYVINVSKNGYFPVNQGIYLDKDMDVEVVLEYDANIVNEGTCWIFDKQNEGLIYKMSGSGNFVSNKSYYDFTVTANLKYDEQLATQGTGDHYYQQRSGIRMQFSNDKVWHVDILREGDQYILQYAKFSGDNSLTSWKTLRKLNDYEIRQYKSDEGLRLRIMRQGKLMGVWLGNTLLVIEDFGDKMQYCSAQVGLEAWIANQEMMEIPFTVTAGVPVDVAGSPFHWPANIWDISNQYNGTFTKFPAPGKDTWLDTKIDCNDVTTICKDLDPDSLNYCMVYIFKFSNGESFRLRLNHTDTDGKFRVQSFAGSTLSPVWKNYYTLTDEQAEKALKDGVEYRVQILGTTAYVYIDGVEACTVDLSTNVNTGEPSGIENATVRVSFRLDGNNVGNTVVPFKLANNSKNVILNIAQTENGTITAEKSSYKIGDTVKLIVNGAENYYYSNLSVDGNPVILDWDGTYSFVADKNIYNISGIFDMGILAEKGDTAWNLLNQNQGVLLMESHESGNSGVVSATGVTNDVYTVVKDLAPDAKNFSMIYDFVFSNGEKFIVRLNHTDDDGKYRIQSMSGSTVVAPWMNAYTLSDAEAAKVAGDGIKFQVTIKGTTAYVSLDGTEVCTYDLSKVAATDAPSGVEEATVSASIRMDGNLGQDVEVPFAMADVTDMTTITIAELTNGTVATDKVSYKLGDTVTLTISPDAGYSQKLYINGQPLKLDWRTKQYTFVAELAAYEITGSFEPSMPLLPSEEGRWDGGNQAHGVLNTYYPANTDSWWMDITGEYQSITVKAKNYMSVEDTKDGVNGSVGFATILRVTMDNGNKYAFRVYNDKGTYAYQRCAISGSLTGWANWKNIHYLASEFNGDGVEFKLARTGDNTLTLFVNGSVIDNYTMEGITADNKVASMGVQHNGNKGIYVEIPFSVSMPGDAADVQINIDALTNGTVTAEKANYKVGDIVTLNVAPNAGYSQKLFINGKALKLDWKTNKYTFIAEETTYTITGSFEKSLSEAPSDATRWDSNNQAHGVITTYYPSANNSWWYNINGNYKSIAVTAKNYLPLADSSEGNGTVGYSVVLAATLDNGKLYAFRIINEKESGTNTPRYIYTRYGASGSVTGWGGFCTLESKVPGVTEKLQGNGAEFKLTRTGDNTLQITLDGVVLDTYTMEGVTAANKVTSVGIYHYGNKGLTVEIPYALTSAGAADDVQINIDALTNGTVTADKAAYKLGDTVTLTVTPDAGYSQKLFVNGKALKLDWKTNKYSFVAEEAAYDITGSFEESVEAAPSEAARWDSSNQAHGVLNTYYPANDDSWWMDITGEYESITVQAKNYMPLEDTKDGVNGSVGFATILRVTMDNGNKYAFRVYNDKGTYAYQRCAISGSLTGWANWKNIHDLASEFNGDGVEFKLARTGDNTLTLFVNGSVIDTYTMEGITADNKVASMGVQHNGNKGVHVEIPFDVAKPGEEFDVQLAIATMTNGTVTADKASYKGGETVTLTVTPASGYVQKLYINGDPLLLDHATGKYSFVASEAEYNITGDFVKKSDWFWTGDWNLSNQGHSVAHAPAHPAGTERTGDLVPTKGICNGVSVLFQDASKGNQTAFAIVLKMHFAGGKKAEVRLVDRDDNGKYCLQAMGDSFSSWNTLYWLTAEENAAVLSGKGVWYGMKREGTKIILTINNVVVKEIDLSSQGITASTVLDQVKVQAYNFGYELDVPYTFQMTQ